MLESSSLLIKTARSLAINPKDPPTWSVLAGHSHTVSDSIKSLITSIRYVFCSNKTVVIEQLFTKNNTVWLLALWYFSLMEIIYSGMHSISPVTLGI